ncbi:9433_t:CDS:2 [Paraglomus occultum]|uniref:Trimethylguanosine synthase n=1 Tax=Paraglomus occultum TaxID=144539 RepID=A0A9N8ZWW8_9GLOM|nr:9433_t:CDS:2 [Paraglomus occultum]
MSDTSVALSNTKKRKRKRNKRKVVDALGTNAAAIEDSNQSISSKKVKIDTVTNVNVNNKNSWNDNELNYDRSAISLDIQTMPAHLQKYWHQRYVLFSRYDEGILMDEEGWYSVTPEDFAKHIAERCACGTIIDACCGVGGNAIQFAFTCDKVIAIDNNLTRLHCAKENAKIYGVEDRIEFIHGDFFELAPKLQADVVFLSPPWGGPTYLDCVEFDIKTMINLDGIKLYNRAKMITKNIAYYLPRHVNVYQLRLLAGTGNSVEVQEMRVNDILKANVAYFGELVVEP